MSLRLDVLAAILAMAVATYLCRAGGYAVLRVVRPPPFVQAMLAYLPGCIFVAFLAPALADGGWPAWGAGTAALLVQARFRTTALAILAGVATLWLLRLVAG
ncbi:AzlD domain-containing protein [Siccirubricoccus sp. KC 17139]|uniref:AzlD domain-containing protein n=1 Tax=Siccirubricoccus soli TaxID=2899147 RepID=A0ABT1CZZ9_9PROT|nr:AzlD domain-containing protein [Siccirubricoccus soli]MCO6415236.1 AzlD domain-containing protein [Siccirubricoccus soli]MCP2681367.1 AzlD domain-containing protein [Siccirubricoccus soli]